MKNIWNGFGLIVVLKYLNENIWMGKIEDETNPEKKKFKNTEKFSLSLHGVPLVDYSEVSKISTYYYY